ncbi:MAG: LLM class flavin-dependent oxidoreductase [Alphaproteobacteria bacterium]
MDFGVLQFFSWPGRRVPLEQVYERALNRIEIMDKTGFDAVWLAEHHFSTYSVCPSVHMMGMHVAGRTKRLRIGTGVTLAAFYHPLRIAEEVALLDVLSGGRVNWGAGRGFDFTEFEIFGVPVPESKTRFREAVEIVLAAWQNERLTWDSKHWQFKDVEVLPKPAQDPHPPVWVAGSSHDSVSWAGELGHSVMLSPHLPFKTIDEHQKLFRASLREHGHNDTERQIPVARLLAVADSEDEAAETARRGAEWIFSTYRNESKNANYQANQTGNKPEVTSVDQYLDDVAIWGTPEKVTDTLHRLEEEINLNYLMCAPLSHASFMTFTEKVLPKFV